MESRKKPLLNIIGLGLGDQNDITLNALNAVRASSKVFLEKYTSILGVDSSALSLLYGKEVKELFRDDVEQGIDEVLLGLSKSTEVFSFLVVGDAFCATTHSDLFLRAVKLGIEIKVFHNASIMNAIGVTGMQVYRFGETVSIPFFTENWKPYSFYDKVLMNLERDLHTLCLLDIRVKELTLEGMAKGKPIYEPPSFMSVNVALRQVLECEAQKVSGSLDAKAAKCIGVARIGLPDQCIVAGTLQELLDVDFGAPLHSLVICGKTLHAIEEEMYEFYHVKNRSIVK